ncbi:MAG: hypothetical protein GXX85_11280 [Ignavibacteria bacterium]|nr:hypothetical protein [Ignavibacteria bacterium]
MKCKFNFRFVFFVIIISGCLYGFADNNISKKLTVFTNNISPQYLFALEKLNEVVPSSTASDESAADIIIIQNGKSSIRYNLKSSFDSLKPEGYSINKLPENKIALVASDQSGVIYGLLDIAEQIQMGKSISDIQEKTVNPSVEFRAIKFNLPWNSYRVDESLKLHTETVRDLNFWKDFLDMMVENRFNALTLWNLHPFPFMIRAKNFPEACPFTDEELAEWQSFWKGLFKMAKDRGTKTFMVNFNIFVSPSFAQKYKVADYCLPHMEGKEYYGDGDYSEIVQRYNQESFVQVINEYPDLTGFGVSQNERMEGVDEQVWQDWIVDTYFSGIEKADRKIELLLRAHTHPAPELTRKAVEDNAYKLGKVWMDVKFNWSHSHSSPKLMFIHGGSKSQVLWNPVPENYKMIYTMRNEDFFILRWGEPDFIRDVIKENDKEYLGGFMIGAETLIPAKEYITKPGAHLTWKYGFEKQWLFYQVWGRLLYDSSTKDEVFANTFNRKYDIDFGDKLIEAHKLADKMPLKLASYYCASWDFTLYSEGFIAGYRSNMGSYYDSISPFISVDEIIGAVTLDTNYVSVKDYVNGNYGENKATPLELASGLERDGKKALEIIKDIKTVNPTLIHEIADIETWSYLSLYFAEKLKGSTALQMYRVYGNPEKQKESILYLEKALGYWENVVEITSWYVDEIPLLHLGDKFNNGGNLRNQAKFSWANFTGEVKYDIEIVKNSTPEK